jgi:hypothetical protein
VEVACNPHAEFTLLFLLRSPSPFGFINPCEYLKLRVVGEPVRASQGFLRTQQVISKLTQCVRVDDAPTKNVGYQAGREAVQAAGSVPDISIVSDDASAFLVGKKTEPSPGGVWAKSALVVRENDPACIGRIPGRPEVLPSGQVHGLGRRRIDTVARSVAGGFRRANVRLALPPRCRRTGRTARRAPPAWCRARAW